MKEPITDLELIKHLGKVNEEQNFKFRTFLKTRDGRRLDRIVHELNDEITEKIDCTQCGNCCALLSTTLTNKEIGVLSKYLNLTVKEFESKYTDTDDERKKCLSNIPCIFLNEKKCSVYDIKPKECAEYPYLHKKNFSTRLLGVLGNYSICPIVFNVYERLKVIYNFR